MGAYDCDCINNLKYDRRERKAQLSKEGTTKGATSDLISRMETVEHLRRMLEATVPNTDYDEGYVDGVEFGISTVSTMSTIQPQSTTGQLNDGARSTAQSTNLIDRQQALKALRKCQTYLYDARDPELKIELSSAEAAINNLPTIQPEPHWIPVSERMPEEHEWIGTKKFGTTISDEVYVTFENEKGERFCQHMKFQNGELSRYDQFHMDTWFKGSKPIAWMPLPEPYKPNKK